jgi:hypothetical protein
MEGLLVMFPSFLPSNKLSLRLPSFFVVGAQKAGTTSLQKWLAQQPDVCLPGIKETGFFNRDNVYSKGISWYVKQFPTCGPDDVMGEINPEYMFCNKAAFRIKEWIRSPKIIFILRNPVHRAYSHYRMTVSRGYEELPFIDALFSEKARLSADDDFGKVHFSYMARSRYFEQISRFKEVFPDSEMLYIKFDDLISQEKGLATYERICKFIGIKSSPSLADRSTISNRAGIPRSFYLNKLLYARKRPLTRKVVGWCSRPIPSDMKLKVGLLLDRLNQKPVGKATSRGELSAVPAEILMSAIREIGMLEALTKLDLQDWLEDMERSM